MYTMVLMAALTTGGETPNCHRGGLLGHGCHGGGYSGCYGGCYGGGCYGGCYGSSYGGCYGGCYGCYGGGYGCYGYSGYSALPAYGCYGCYGGFGCYGASSYSPVLMPDVPADKKVLPKKGAALSAPARLLVQVPADAKLYIDNRLMKSATSSRTYSTPALTPGQVYYYELRAEVVRNGKVLSETKKVLVRAGQDSRTEFAESTMPVAATGQGD